VHPETGEDRFYAVDEPRLLPNQGLTLAVRPSRVLLDRGWDRRRTAMALLSAQPAEKGAQQQLGIEAIGFGAPVLARDCYARGINNLRLDLARPQPAMQ